MNYNDDYDGSWKGEDSGSYASEPTHGAWLSGARCVHCLAIHGHYSHCAVFRRNDIERRIEDKANANPNAQNFHARLTIGDLHILHALGVSAE